MDALRAYGVDEIFEEKVSGTKKSRPQLNALLNQLRTGDTLVTLLHGAAQRSWTSYKAALKPFKSKPVN